MQRTLATREFEITELAFSFGSLARGDLFVEAEGFKNFGEKAPIFMKLSKSEKVIVGSSLFYPSSPDSITYKVRKLANR